MTDFDRWLTERRLFEAYEKGSLDEKLSINNQYAKEQKGSGFDESTLSIVVDKVAEKVAEKVFERRRSRDKTIGSDRSRKRPLPASESTPSPDAFRNLLIDRALKHKYAKYEEEPKKKPKHVDEKKAPTKDKEKEEEEEEKKPTKIMKISCDLCEEWFDPIFCEAAHVIPKREMHREIVRRRILDSSFVGLTDFVSINEKINGLMLCKMCHTEFDRLPPDLNVDSKGQKVYKGSCPKRRVMHGKTARWWTVAGYPNNLVFNYRIEVQAEVDSLKLKKEYSKMTVKLLKADLMERGLSISGLKADLIKRLEEHDEVMGKYIDDGVLPA